MKDYKKLEERINKDKEITIGDITELGYSRYDINLFIEAGILSRAKRGLYTYLPELTKVEEIQSVTQTIQEQPVKEETTIIEQKEDTNIQEAYRYVNEGIKKITKRENKEAIELFDKALELDNNNSHARIGLIGAFVFLNDYENAYTELINFYNNRKDNSLLHNIYYYLLILKEHINVDERLLEDIKIEIEENKNSIKKTSLNFKRLYNALNENDYLNALKYINYSISLDKQHKNYHITNHIYKSLIMSTLKLKGIDPFFNINQEQSVIETQPQEVAPVTEESTPVVEEEIIIVPETKIEDTIKTNLLLEAINNNNYELALSLLEQEQIDNPYEVIKTLLSKLSLIKSLITSSEPIKVVEVTPVHIVEEQHIEESLEPTIEESVEEQPIVEEPIIEEPTPTQEELINITYKAYKDAYHSEQFDVATKNLRRYEYLNNTNGTRRNINYHYIRIEQSKKDFELNPERYLKKKTLSKLIFDLKRERRFDEALSAIAEFKSLGGIKNELVILVEAEIYYALGDYNKTSVILNGIRTSEEPSYFILASKLAYKNYKFQDALLFCQSYNERRPNQSPSNYQLMGDCYTKLGKNGKAIKFYRKAEEVAAQYGGKPLNLSGKINRQEMFAEFKKEERDARSLGKKK
jgi:predicted Zn-dependent protease